MTKPTHVLAVTDLSEASDEALRQANGYARMTAAKLSVLHVVPDWMRANLLIPEGSPRETNTEIEMEERALDDLAARVKEVTGALLLQTSFAALRARCFAASSSASFLSPGTSPGPRGADAPPALPPQAALQKFAAGRRRR
jgi:nucleotide-binding universal stress UspA family protein